MFATQRRIFAAALLTLLVLFPFQNCINPPSSSNAQNTDALWRSINGEGYTGKPYFNIDVAGTCGPAGQAKAVIIQQGDRYYQTVKDCSKQTPVDVTLQLGIKAYNTSAFFAGSLLFERLENSQVEYSTVICRGLATRITEGQKPFADVSMQPTGIYEPGPAGLVPIYRGYVKLGTYDANDNLISSEEFPINKARALETMAGDIHYAIEAQSGSGDYALHVQADGKTASFLFFRPGEDSMPLVVDNMSCGSHKF